MIQQNTPPAADHEYVVPAEPVRQSFGRVFRDLATLADLQGQLFRSDARDIRQRIGRPLAVFLAGSLLFAATVPVALLAIVQTLVALGLPQAGAYGLVAVTSLAAGAGTASWAWRGLRAMPPAFARSREELMRNIDWIKDALEDLAAGPEHPGNGKA